MKLRRLVHVLAVSSAAISGSAWALDARMVRSSLVTGYRPCNETDADTCVGPVPVAPEKTSAPPDATCPHHTEDGTCDHIEWCRPACSTPVRNDDLCGFDPKVGKGKITGRMVPPFPGAPWLQDFLLEATAQGITGPAGSPMTCEGQELCFGFQVRQTGEYFNLSGEDSGQYTINEGYTSPALILGEDDACCTVSRGRCTISLQRSPGDPGVFGLVDRDARTFEETFSGCLYRTLGRSGYYRLFDTAHPTFVAGQQFGKRSGQPLNHPRTATNGKASFVEGYRKATFSFHDPSVPNDPHCRFGAKGKGTSTVKVTGSDVKVTIKLSDIACDGEGDVQLCLTSSGRLTTTDCASPSGCTLVAVPDEPVGRVNPTEGCCEVKAQGRRKGVCSIRTSVGKVRQLDPDKYSAAMFLGGGLQRITPMPFPVCAAGDLNAGARCAPAGPGGGCDQTVVGDNHGACGPENPLADTLPAFVVGLFVP